MGICSPMNYQDVWQAVRVCDVNGNSRISRMEMFLLF